MKIKCESQGLRSHEIVFSIYGSIKPLYEIIFISNPGGQLVEFLSPSCREVHIGLVY